MPARFVRRRPLLRTAVIGGGAYMAGRSAATRRDAAADQDARNSEQQGGPAQQDEPSQQAAGSPMLDQLDRLTALHQDGTLTDAEFSAAKAKLLGS